MQGRRLASEKDYGGKRPCPICGKQIAREFLAGHADRCFAKSFEGDKKSHDEVTRLRGGWQRITSRALDDVKGLPEAVEAVDARLRDMPEGAYAYTKASGALDLKRNEALRELVAEEETRLESFQPEQQGQRKKKTTTTLDVLAGAAATTKTVNRLRILARAAHEAQQDDEPVILAAATRPLAKKRGRPRGSTTTTANHGRGPKHLKRILPATAASLPAEKKSASSVAAAKEYIERMQHVHKVDTKIIVSFARCLKAFHNQQISRAEVAATVEGLLEDYPDLIGDFYKFLPEEKKDAQTKTTATMTTVTTATTALTTTPESPPPPPPASRGPRQVLPQNVPRYSRILLQQPQHRRGGYNNPTTVLFAAPPPPPKTTTDDDDNDDVLTWMVPTHHDIDAATARALIQFVQAHHYPTLGGGHGPTAWVHQQPQPLHIVSAP